MRNLLWAPNPDLSPPQTLLDGEYLPAPPTIDSCNAPSRPNPCMGIFSWPRGLKSINDTMPRSGHNFWPDGRHRLHPSRCRAVSPYGLPSSGGTGPRLAIVDRGRGQYSRKEDLSIDHPKMEIESLPILGPALAVPLASPVTILGGWIMSLKNFRRVFFFSGRDSPFRGRPRFRDLRLESLVTPSCQIRPGEGGVRRNLILETP